MASYNFIKSNKALISKAVHTLEKHSSKVRHKVVYYRDEDIELWHSIPVVFPHKMKIVDENDKVYIGLDLSYVRLMPEEYQEYFFDDFVTALKGGYVKSLRLSDDYIKRFREKYDRDYKMIKFEKSFKDAVESFNNATDTCDLKVYLMEGEWPKLSDRSILPVLIIDKKTCMVDCSGVDGGGNSYNQRRLKFLLGSENFNLILKSYSNNRWSHCYDSLYIDVLMTRR